MRSDIHDVLRVDIASDGMTASIYPNGPCPDRKPVASDIAEVLRARGVVDGVDQDSLQLFIEDWSTGTIAGPRVVASGTTPKAAAAPSLKRVSPPARSGADPVELLPLFVKSGEIIFSLRSTAAPRIGRSVRGEEIPPGTGSDGCPIPGTGIETHDGRWRATRSGFLVISGHRIDVSETLTHNRDLPPGDYRWGGDVKIVGDVLTGTTLRAQGAIQIDGTVHDGVSIVGGADVRVTKVVEGNDTKIIASGAFRASAIRGATVYADGDVTVTHELHNATLRTQGALDAATSPCIVTGSRIDAVRGASIYEIEATRHQRTMVSVGSADWINDESKSIEDEVERWEAYHSRLFESFQSEFRGLIGDPAKIKKLPGKAQKKFGEAQREISAEQTRVDIKIRELRQRQTDLDSHRSRDESATITVRNGAAPDTRFSIRGRAYKEASPLAKGRTICVNPETGRVHAVPTGLIASSDVFG